MKYSNEIIINLPRTRVIELFDNADNMTKWMEGLQSFETISGEPGIPGAKARLKFKSGKREFEMIETVLTNNLPDEMTGSYEVKGTINSIVNRFEETEEGNTKWIAHNEFILKGIFMKIMAFLMPGIFKKQSKKFMLAFKEFAESQV